MNLKLKRVPGFDDFLMDLDADMGTHGFEKADIIIQLGLAESRIKPVGDCSLRSMTTDYCPTDCGCRLNTDGRYFWCSSPKCDFIGVRE